MRPSPWFSFHGQSGGGADVWHRWRRCLGLVLTNQTKGKIQQVQTFYRVVPESRVEEFQKYIVRWSAAIAARDLKINVPKIDFLTPCDGDNADIAWDNGWID